MNIKNLFRSPSAETIALRELETAKRELLQVQDTQEYSAKMVEYYQGKILRLTAYLKTNVTEAP
jgi:hypothetical protein